MKVRAAIQRHVFQTLIDETGRIDVHVDTRVDGCVLPTGLDAVVLLNVWVDDPGRVQDLHIDDDGWSATMSFNASPYCCFVPWDAVYIIESVDLDDGDRLSLVYEVLSGAAPEPEPKPTLSGVR